MATEPDRSRPLHNFELPRLRWGNQRLLRCMKYDRRSSSATDALNRSRAAPQFLESSKKSSPLLKAIGHSNGIEAIRDNLMFNLKTAAANDTGMLSIIEEKDSAAEAAPWNLRTRKASNRSPLRPESPAAATAKSGAEERREKDLPRVSKLSVSLSREEVERDFLVMVGRRPPRRPKKRPKIIQRQVDAIFPGLWLTDITTDAYKVPDIPESAKGSR